MSSKKSSTNSKPVPLTEGLRGRGLVDNGAQGQGFRTDAVIQIKGGAQGQTAPVSALSALPKGGTGTEKGSSGSQGPKPSSGGSNG
jgi:hypothetical protein